MKPKYYNDNTNWPKMRCCHSAVSLNMIGNTKEESPLEPEVMIIYGRNSKFENFKDAWIFNVENHSWMQVSGTTYGTRNTMRFPFRFQEKLEGNAVFLFS